MTTAGSIPNAPEAGRGPDTDSPPSPLPRLSLRFAIYAIVVVSLAAAIIIILVRGHTLDQAEAAVEQHSRVVARATLAKALRAGDFSTPVTQKRRGELDKIFRDRVLEDGIVEAVFLAPDGRVTYATNHDRIGRRSQDAQEVRRIFGSNNLHTQLDTFDDGMSTQKVMKVFVPARLDGGPARGVLVLSHDWTGMLKSSLKVYIAIALVLEAVLLALYASFFPVLRRVTNRLHAAELALQPLNDPVTGLPNRLLFRDRAEQALLRAKRAHEAVAVMLVSLDRLHDITDTLGDERRDALLRELAERVPTAIRASDTFARRGFAEFAVVAPRAGDDDLALIVERLIAVIDRPFFVDGLEVDVAARMGIARYPHDADDVTTLVLRADIAMDDARESKSRYAFYDPERDDAATAAPTPLGGVRAAIDADELVLEFQPKFDLRNGAMVGAEALVRWRDPDRGLLQPADFLVKASESRQTPALTRWVLQSALRECRAWYDRGWRLPVAVNIDRRSLLDESFVDEIELELNHNGLDAELLELEITEATVTSDQERVAPVLAQLSEFGVRLTLDDFGSGLSALGNLQSLPIDELKIDRSLVGRLGTDPTVRPAIASILSLGNTLGLRVIAEGIETQTALRSVVRAKCWFGQGFLLSEPLPSEEFIRVLEYTHQHDAASAATA